MRKVQEVTIRLDRDNDLAYAWFEQLLESSQHPIYQNGIRVMKSIEVEEEA